MSGKKSLSIVFVCLMVSSLASLLVPTAKAASYSPHAPIRIESNADFTPANGVVSGDGSQLSPYNISGWEIDGGAAPDGIGIWISNTTLDFVVRDVHVFVGDAGIRLHNASNGLVTLVNFSDNAGIRLEDCNDIAMNQNTMNEGSVYALSCSRLSIVANQLWAIQLDHCQNATVSSNIVSGLFLQYSVACTIQMNTITVFGVAVTGDSLSNFNSHTISTDNQLNGVPIYYYKNLTSLDLDGVIGIGQLIVVNCSNARLNALNISDAYIPMTLAYDEASTVSNVILAPHVAFDSKCIFVYRCNDTKFSDSTFTDSSMAGIWIEESSYTLVQGNEIFDTNNGIYARNNVSHLVLKHNNVSNMANVGVWLELAIDVIVDRNNISAEYTGILDLYCTDLVISSNNISAKNWEGVEAYSSSGLELSNNTIVGYYMKVGLIEYLLNYGIRVSDTNGLKIADNRLLPGDLGEKGFSYGISISRSENVSIARNDLSWSDLIVLSLSNCSSVELAGNHVVFNGRVSYGASGVWLLSVTEGNVSGNSITGKGNGIVVEKSSELRLSRNDISSNTYDAVRGMSSSNLTLWENNMTSNGAGLDVDTCDNWTIYGNHFQQNGYGVWFYQSTKNQVYFNSFVNNANQAYDDSGNQNSWDQGYPAGGNFWSNHTGPDVKSGPDQDLPGSDGIVDNPYNITPSGQDRYPLVALLPPTTTSSMAGISGSLGWFVSPVNVSLVASGGMYGMNYTEYNLDGGLWQRYSAPVLITADGIHVLQFRSVDNASQIEQIKLIAVRIDTVAPVTTAAVFGSSVWLNSSDMTSGIGGTKYRIDNGSWQSYSGKLSVVIVGTHTVEYYSVDVAGNQENMQSVTFVVKSTDQGGVKISSGTLLLIGFVVVIAAAVVTVLLLMRRRKGKVPVVMVPVPGEIVPPE